MNDNFSGGTNMWDERFSSYKNLYTTQPNVHFAQFLENKKPGKILLPGDGQGRNGVFAARLGWEVTTFDYSEVAVQQTQELARANGVNVKSIHSSIEDIQFETDQFDVIATVFLHLPPVIRSTHFPRLIQYLKTGGTFFLLGFNKRQIDLNSGGPKNIDMLFSREELSNNFSMLHFQKLEEFKFDLNEGPKHQGTAEMIEMVGIKA